MRTDHVPMPYHGLMMDMLEAIPKLDQPKSIRNRDIDRAYQRIAAEAALIAQILCEPELVKELQKAAVRCHTCGTGRR
jgi:hypothetical protein